MADSWNSLEVAKLIIGALTPLTVAIFGFFISKRLKRLDHALWTNQKLTEKRLAVYDEVAPKLNRLLCFYTWVGPWKETTPIDALRIKRELDATFNIYRHLFEGDVYSTYQALFRTLFETYTGAGRDAKLLTLISGPDGDRSALVEQEWDARWVDLFSNPKKVTPIYEIRIAHNKLMTALTRSVGVIPRDERMPYLF